MTEADSSFKRHTKQIGKDVSLIDESDVKREKSLLFNLGKGNAAELVFHNSGVFGLNITTTDKEGVVYGCWFENTPDEYLSETNSTERDEQLLLNLRFGQAVKGERRFFPVSKKIKNDGLVILIPIPNPKYPVYEAFLINGLQTQVNIAKSVFPSNSESNKLKLSQAIAEDEKLIKIAKKIGQFSQLLENKLDFNISDFGNLMSDKQKDSINILLNAINLITNGKYKESKTIYETSPEEFRKKVERLRLFKNNEE